MANRTRFRATGLAAIVGRLTVKHSTSSRNKSSTTVNTQTSQRQGRSNAGSRRSRKA